MEDIQDESLFAALKRDLVLSTSNFVMYVLLGLSFYLLSTKIGEYATYGPTVKLAEFQTAYNYHSFSSFLNVNWLYFVLSILLLIASLIGFYFLSKRAVSVFDSRIIGNSVLIQILTISSLLIGIYTSVTSSSILGWLAPIKDEIGVAKFGIEYCLFFFLCLLFLFVKHGLVSTKLKQKELNDDIARSDKLEKAQSERVDKLQEFMRLMPPGDFASKLSTYADILEDFSSELVLELTSNYVDNENRTLEDWEQLISLQKQYIRASVIAFARLAANYDCAVVGPSSSVTYRANLMIKADDKEQKVLFGGEEYEKRFFLNIDAKPSYQLSLHKNYSVKVNNQDDSLLKAMPEEGSNIRKVKDFKHDEEVNNLVLPVYVDDTEKSTVYNMLGAPLAVATCQPQFIPDTEKSTKHLNDAQLPKPLIEEAIKYFKQDYKGKSIVALPLSTKRYTAEHLKPANINGVLNIYRDKADLFSGDDDKFNNFFHLTSPLLVSLSRIVEYHLIALALKDECGNIDTQVDS
ncbi:MULTISPECIES: hypothetical protein [Aliivibrio]|uniref:Uncharacterized protein n=1 Tax=Aliivibrio finisterrensis TaxID=511998 RepID=A0A4Q5KZS7_9GAMM|nr:MULTISPECIES: hypothetical protein [Aliivibrio]MDD9177346.1 hypothetical protein [Aliivibrio sp. A6]RYU54828.1 hypothetical protein ERW57_00855 [Aliivibrio finisterrensis]RYU56503.1 hypothetical protein ERW56_00535 [Aliivibrio finisterrensis]RYU61624.1 hypothetical protein ERW50_00535 [Aliivibrio finisterrensis]RYU66787.1 hypothetical protein ERW53_01315 [Aliivibrio finisterrensis]